jgi:peroxiredoxin
MINVLIIKKMKRFIGISSFFILSLVMVSCGVDNNKGFNIKADLSNDWNGTVTLNRYKIDETGELVLDSLISVEMIKGKFVLSGAVDYPSFCILSVKSSMNGGPSILKSYAMILENNKDTIYYNIIKNKREIIGSTLATKVLDLHKRDTILLSHYIELDKSRKNYTDNIRNKDVTESEREFSLQQLVEAGEIFEKERKIYILQQLKSNEDLLVKAILLEIYEISEQEEIEIAESLIREISAKYGEDYYHTKLLKHYLEVGKNLQKTAIGSKYIDFETSTLENEKVKFSSALGDGKYVLLEFWASWCTPCRKEMPTMKKAYQKFSSKGFEIFGVSADQEIEAWHKASEQENLPWINTIPLSDDEENAIKMYSVSSYPTNFLIDPNGIIIAKNVRGAALEEKLIEIFGE